MGAPNYEAHKTSPLKAIRAKCIDCCVGNVAEVKLCHITECDLHPYRMGKNPFRAKRVVTDEQREAFRLRMANAREARV